MEMEITQALHVNGNAANGHVDASGLCIKKAAAPVADPLNWGAAAEAVSGSHLDEVKRMVEEYRRPLVKLEGAALKISQVAAVARGGGAAAPTVELLESSRDRVRASSEWVMESMNKGTDSYGVTTWILLYFSSIGNFKTCYPGKARFL